MVRTTAAWAIGLFAWRLVAVAALVSTPAAAADNPLFKLEILWSTPIAGAPPPAPVGTVSHDSFWGTGLALSRETLLSDGRLAFLGIEMGPKSFAQSLLLDPEHDGFDKRVTLQLAGVPPTKRPPFVAQLGERPGISTITAGPEGDILVGGSTNTYMDMGSAFHRDAYLARIDQSGKPRWEKIYGDGGSRPIREIVPMPGGDMVVAGDEWRRSWIARIASDGGLRWDLKVGNDKGISVAALPGDRVLVAGVEATGAGLAESYRDSVTAWIIDGSGKILAQTRVRDAINSVGSDYSGDVTVMATESAAYVKTSWQDMFHARPVELSKLDLDGKLLWSTPLPDSLVAVQKTITTWNICLTAMAIMSNGDPLVACALDGQIRLYQFDGSTGAYRESLLPLPECQAEHPAALLLTARNDGTMSLSGSRESNNVAANCTWVGRLVATP